MLDPAYLFESMRSIQTGSMVGGLRAIADWIGDLQHDIETYTGEPIALANVLIDELLRGLFEDNPKGLSQDTKRVVEASQLLAPLKLLGALTAQDDLIRRVY
jgi:hypothetical protein